MTSRTTETHQETPWDQIKGMQALHTSSSLSATLPLNHHSKTPHQIPPRLGHTILRASEPRVPFAWQNNKAILFYFSQNSVSRIQFSTSLQRSTFGITVRWLYSSSTPLQDGIRANGKEICWPHESKKRGSKVACCAPGSLLVPKESLSVCPLD